MRLRQISRGRIALLTLALLVLLDLGRSVYARVGYARPVQVWQPNPAVYADMTWPPGADLPPNVPLGRRVYAQRCAVCHGPDGRGNGPAAPSMIPRPRDFTRGEFKYRSTGPNQLPTDHDLRRVVRDGLRASAMPYWRGVLSDDEIRAVVAYVKVFSPAFGRTQPLPMVVPPRVAPSPTSLARGRALYQQRCETCHGQDGRAWTLLQDAKRYPVIARDLTAPWTFRGGSEPEQLWLRLTNGLPPGPMPSFASVTTPEERWDIVNYVLSLARMPPWASGGRLEGPGQDPDLVRRGGYLIRASMCGLCHTPINRTGIYRGDDFYLGGGMRVGAYPHGLFISRNLTADPQTGLGQWTEAQIVEALRNGRSPDRLLNIWDMPWPWLHRLTDDDARAIARYLKTQLPAVRQWIPGPLQYGVIETILVKLMHGLPAANPGVLTFADGMFGQIGGLSRDLPQRLLIGAQWLVLLVGTVVALRVRPTQARPTSRWRGIAAVLLGFLVALVGWALYALPMLRMIPPEQLVAGATGDIPSIDQARFPSKEHGALSGRGQYVYLTASCALCHGADGAGGAKISWRPFGTLWVRNITPDPETGLGRWSDDEIARAIRSGVSRDGRALHWQGMIWDHASNWDEEDIRALIVYLRALPPIRRVIPAPRPPAPDDCAVYSFWTQPSQVPGCR